MGLVRFDVYLVSPHFPITPTDNPVENCFLDAAVTGNAASAFWFTMMPVIEAECGVGIFFLNGYRATVGSVIG